jgi:hypothetical protein
MTSVEKTLFKDMRDAGSISVFKMGSCVVCGDDVIKGKKFCSRECKEKDYEARELD